MDIYSFGIVLYELASSMDPFEEFKFKFISMMEEQILAGKSVHVRSFEYYHFL